jgi:hypothetical protein
METSGASPPAWPCIQRRCSNDVATEAVSVTGVLVADIRDASNGNPLMNLFEYVTMSHQSVSGSKCQHVSGYGIVMNRTEFMHWISRP